MMASARKLTEVDAREVIMTLIQSGKWEVWLTEDCKRIILRTRPQEVHTLSDIVDWPTSLSAAATTN